MTTIRKRIRQAMQNGDTLISILSRPDKPADCDRDTRLNQRHTPKQDNIVLLIWMVRLHLSCMQTIATRKRSFRQGKIFTPVCHSVHRGGGVPAPPDQVHSPGTRYPPRDQLHPRDQVPPRTSACQEIRATSSRYASYWNAFLFSNHFSRVCVSVCLSVCLFKI